MRKLPWISLIVSTLLLGNDRVELYGTVADANGSLAHADGDPVILYQDQILSADTLTYDNNTSVIEATGSVNVFKGGQYHVISDYSRVDLLKDTYFAKPYYMFDQVSEAWMSTEEAQGCKNEIDLSSGAVSGCNSADPLWKIRFTSADYDTDAMWVNLYNARLEIENVPVFYLPYFGYPTDRTRRSGLLIPSFGLSSKEGFYYQQPIYIAPQNWWDMELRPQIRTSRGAGLYTDIRFVDTPSSEGSIQLGYFKEQNNYAQEYDLINREHYGYGVNYRHSAPLREWFDSKLEGESGLYVDAKWMNDVDYLNLQKTDETQNVTDKQVFSRINGYYSSEDNYLGAYFKYYQYLDQESNTKTIQTLPSLHYHRYLESFLDDYLLANADIRATHFYRPDGKKAAQVDFNVPLTLQTSLFDNYLDASYTANASGRGIGFYGASSSSDNSVYKPGYYAQLDHTFALSSTLVRNYESLSHVITPSVSYTSAGTRYYRGYYKTYRDACTSGDCEFYTLDDPNDSLSLGINNYLIEDGQQILADRLSQNFRYDDQRSYYGELQNELEWEITTAISYYNQTAFNHDRNRITKEQNTLRYNDGIVTAGLTHYYTDELVYDTVKLRNVPTYVSYLTADAAYQYNSHYRYFGSVAYDYHEAVLKRGEVGFLYSTRCLDFGLKYVKNRRPMLTNITVSDSVDDSYVFITIILKPIGGSDFSYKMTN